MPTKAEIKKEKTQKIVEAFRDATSFSLAGGLLVVATMEVAGEIMNMRELVDSIFIPLFITGLPYGLMAYAAFGEWRTIAEEEENSDYSGNHVDSSLELHS